MTNSERQRFVLGMIAGLAGGVLLTMAVSRLVSSENHVAGTDTSSEARSPRVITPGQIERTATTISGLSTRGNQGRQPRPPVHVSASGDDLLKGEMGSDFAALLGRLQEQGIASELLVSVVEAEFDRRWRDEQGNVNALYRRGELDANERQLLLVRRDEAKEEAIQQLLGREVYEKWHREKTLESLDGLSMTLSESERDALYQIQKELDQVNKDQWVAKLRGDLDAEDFQLQREESSASYEQKLASLLGGDRYADYRMETDRSMVSFRRDMRDLDLEDSQLEYLYAAERTYRDGWEDLKRLRASGQISEEEYRRRFGMLHGQREQQVNGILGDQGLDVFRMVRDGRYKTMRQYASAWNLTGSDIQYVYQVLTDYQRAPRDAMAQQRASQTAETLRQYLGDARYAKLQRARVIPF